MGELRQYLANLHFSDNDADRTPEEARFVAFIRRVADTPVQVVDTAADLPTSAPPTHLYRTKDPADIGRLWLGNGPDRPLSRFVAS